MNSKKKEILKTYNRIAEDYDEEFREPYYCEDLDFFLEKLPGKGEAHILDVGCGCGHDARHVEKRGFAVTGIDFSDKMIQIVRRNCERSRFIKADAETFDYGMNRCDGIIASCVLIHFRTPAIRTLLKKFRESLREGGILLVIMIEGEGEYFGPEPLDPRLKMYFNYVTEGELQKLLTEAGFNIIRLKKRHRKTESMDYTGLFCICVARKKKPNHLNTCCNPIVTTNESNIY
jgi:SAM-dependent methyltransferase